MRVTWQGTFKNARKDKKYPPYFNSIQHFDVLNTKEFYKAKNDFVREMEKYGMVLNDQEILRIED